VPSSRRWRFEMKHPCTVTARLTENALVRSS
jgi:hypothetical protein